MLPRSRPLIRCAALPRPHTAPRTIPCGQLARCPYATASPAPSPPPSHPVHTQRPKPLRPIHNTRTVRPRTSLMAALSISISCALVEARKRSHCFHYSCFSKYLTEWRCNAQQGIGLISFSSASAAYVHCSCSLRPTGARSRQRES